MRSKRRNIPMLLTLGLTGLCLGGIAIAQQTDDVAAQRVENVSARLDRADNEGDRALLAASLRSEVRAFVETSLREQDSSELIQKRLGAVLQSQDPDFEYSDRPTVRVANLRHGRSVVLAYSVVRPPHFDLPTITAFTAQGGGFRQSASTGDDLEGYTLFTQLLPSPTKDVMWLLAGGRAFTFNGSKFRFRVYTFDGERFEEMWSPEDVFDATVRLSADGFSLTHYIRQRETNVTEEYRAMPTGLVRVR